MSNFPDKKTLDGIMDSYNTVLCDQHYSYFYKYVSFDTQMGILNIFNKCQLKFTKPVFFNDPYDCLYHLELDFSDFNKKNCDLAFGYISPNRWLQVKNSLRSKIQNEFRTKFLSAIREQFAVTCFTIDPKSILMWSHYARNHTGFVIEFKFPLDPQKLNTLGALSLPVPVNYTDSFPIIKCNWNVHKAIETQLVKKEHMYEMTLTKAECWAYEKEFRLGFDATSYEHDAPILQPFNPSCISTVIAGSRTSNEHKKILKKTIQDFNQANSQNVKLYNAEINEKKFKIEIPKHPRANS